MNRCEEVLKHSINKGLKIEKDELYHSDTYLGSEYDEGLKHWKYIRKYKNSKGKTVYVYANKDTHNKINNTGLKAEIKDDTTEYYRRQQHQEFQPGGKGDIDRYFRNKERREKAEKQANQYRDMADAMMKRNELFGKTKRNAKFLGKSISEITINDVKRTIDDRINAAYKFIRNLIH